MRQYYSRLSDIKPGIDWMTMCITTSLTIGGTKFDAPDFCEDRGALGPWGGELKFFVTFFCNNSKISSILGGRQVVSRTSQLRHLKFMLNILAAALEPGVA